jgi:phosphoribosylformylglycinamidine (FGAM) synthase-like amidotransferase family enzyme
MVINRENKELEISILELNEKVIPYLSTIRQDKKNKLTYAATILGDEIQSNTKQFSKKLTKLSIEYALKDGDGNFKLTDKGDIIVDPKKMDKYIDAKEKLENETKIKLELYYCNDNELVAELPVNHIKKLNGILFEYDLTQLESEQPEKKVEQTEQN